METKTLEPGKEKRMKKRSHGLAIGIFLALLMVVLIAYTGIADAAAPSTWSKTYGGSGAEEGNKVVSVSDGYVIVGSTNSYGHGSDDVYLVRTYTTGNIRWDEAYGGTGIDHGRAIISDENNLIIAGNKRGNIPCLLKVYPNSTLAWDKEYTVYGWYHTRSVARVGNYYIIAGDYQENNSIFIIKAKLNGDLVWIKSYGESGHKLYSECVIGVTDGGVNNYLVIGYDSTAEDKDVCLLMVKENGDINKKRAIGDADRDETGSSVIAVGSAYYIAGTSISHSNYSDSKAYALRVNSDLNKVWDYTYGDIPVDGNSVIRTADSLVIAGNTAVPNRPYLARISWDGNLIRQYIYNATDHYELNSIVPASDGDYVIAGTVNYFNGDRPDVFLAKIDSSVLDPTPTPVPSPSSAPTVTPTASASPTAAPTEEPGTGPEPTDEPDVEPTSNPVTEPTSVPTAGAEVSVTPVPGAGDTVTPAASTTAQASGGDFSTSSVIIIILLTVIATALVGIGIWLFTQRKK